MLSIGNSADGVGVDPTHFSHDYGGQHTQAHIHSSLVILQWRMLENGLFHHLSREWFVPLFSLPTLNESSCLPLIGRLGCIPRDFALQKEPRPASIHRIEASLACCPIHSRARSESPISAPSASFSPA
ncbi:hypothetical protein MHYP_G00207780 [Metynnis hypsauchen]